MLVSRSYVIVCYFCSPRFCRHVNLRLEPRTASSVGSTVLTMYRDRGEHAHSESLLNYWIYSVKHCPKRFYGPFCCRTSSSR